MTKMTKRELEYTIKHYLKSCEFETARRFVRNHGPQIRNFDMKKACKMIDDCEKKYGKDIDKTEGG